MLPTRKNEWRAWWRLPQQLRFLAAGAFNTPFGYASFRLLFLLFGRWIHYLLIGLTAHAIAVVNAFVVYRTLVFQSTEKWQWAFIRFNVSQLLGVALGMAGLYALVEFVGWSPLLAQAVVTLLSVVLNY